MEEIGLRFNAGVEYNGKLYASAVNINGLFELDLVSHKLKYIKSFIKEKACFAIHKMAFLYKNEAWFIPQNGKYITVINLDTLEMQFIKPPFGRINEKAVSMINAVYYTGDIIEERYLYLIPTNIDTLLIIDLENKKLYPFYDISVEDDFFLFGAYVNENIYLWTRLKNVLMKLNIRTNVREFFQWKYPVEAFGESINYNEKIWRCPFKEEYVLVMDLNAEEIEKIPLNESYDLDCNYEQIQMFDNKMFLVPWQGNKILELDINSKKIFQKYLQEDLLENGKNGFCRMFSKNNVILASYWKNVVLIYDKEHGNFQSIKICIDKNILTKAVEENEEITFKNFIRDNTNFENYLELKAYIQLMARSNEIEEGEFKSNNVGKNIWNIMK